ncbi:hypothetical protein [Spirillospora sp. NPDC029432]|uniref:hypothetical protein n=1 Tax=Spirillospora sp. NPDC029432 TaxID=3154599 RepID=UPI003452A020
MDGATWKRAVTAASRRLLVLGGLVIAGWLLGGAAQAQADAPPSPPPAVERLVDMAERRVDELLRSHPPARPIRPAVQQVVNGGATDTGISWVRERPAERPEAAPRVRRAESGQPPAVRLDRPPALPDVPVETVPMDDIAAETQPPGQFLLAGPLSGEPHNAAPVRPEQPPLAHALSPDARITADAPTFSPD